MEPRSEAELVAVVRARQVARREALGRKARGMGRWEVFITFLQVALVYLFGRWLEGPNAPTSILVTALFVIVAGNVARMNSRIDALLALVSEKGDQVSSS